MSINNTIKNMSAKQEQVWRIPCILARRHVLTVVRNGTRPCLNQHCMLNMRCVSKSWNAAAYLLLFSSLWIWIVKNQSRLFSNLLILSSHCIQIAPPAFKTTAWLNRRSIPIYLRECCMFRVGVNYFEM